MINIGYVLHPSYCGYYCLKHILGKVKCSNKRYISLYTVSEILKKHNYYCSCVRVNNVDDILFDCITLIKINDVSYHYVVLKKKDKKFIYFYDPLFLNVRKMKFSKFSEKWSKICLFYTKV